PRAVQLALQLSGQITDEGAISGRAAMHRKIGLGVAGTQAQPARLDGDPHAEQVAEPGAPATDHRHTASPDIRMQFDEGFADPAPMQEVDAVEVREWVEAVDLDRRAHPSLVVVD